MHPSLMALVKRAAELFPADFDAGVKWGVRRMRRLACYGEIRDELDTKAFRGLLGTHRHDENWRQKKADQSNHPTQRVRVGDSDEMAGVVVEGIFSRKIDGTTLGELDGARIPVLIANRVGIESGVRWERRVLEWLQPRVPPGRKVRECVNERTLTRQDRIIRTSEETWRAYPTDPE